MTEEQIKHAAEVAQASCRAVPEHAFGVVWSRVFDAMVYEPMRNIDNMTATGAALVEKQMETK